MGLVYSAKCDRCKQASETASYVLSDCKALATLRYRHLGFHLMKPGDFEDISVSKMLHFVQGAELLNEWPAELHKISITVETHGSLGAHPSVLYWGCWRINNDWDFVTSGNNQCLLLPSHTLRTLAVHCITHGQERKRSSHNVWTLGCTLLLCACRGLKWLEKSPPSTLQSRPGPLRHPSIWVCNGSDKRLQLYDQWGSPEAVYCCLWTAEMEFHCRRIFKISRMMAKMYQLGWGFCTEVNTAGRFVSHYMFSYSYLYFNVQ